MKPLNVRFQEYYYVNYQLVLKTAFSIVKDDAAAEDVASEVFICLYEYLSRENPPIERIRPWLFVTAKYRAYNYLRDNGRLVPADSGCPSEDTARCDFESRLFTQDLLNCLYRKNPKWFDIVEKYYFLELSAEEIAREYRCTPHAVLTILSRARKYLREKFIDDFRG